MVHRQAKGEVVENCENSEFQEMNKLWWCAAEKGWARCNARLYMYDAVSARFWLEENVIHMITS